MSTQPFEAGWRTDGRVRGVVVSGSCTLRITDAAQFVWRAGCRDDAAHTDDDPPHQRFLKQLRGLMTATLERSLAETPFTDLTTLAHDLLDWARAALEAEEYGVVLEQLVFHDVR